MPLHTVGFVYIRCPLREKLTLAPGVVLQPLRPTGFSGELHDLRGLLEQAGFKFPRAALDTSIGNYKRSGRTAVVTFADVDAPTYPEAITARQDAAEGLASALSLVTGHPVTTLAGFARSTAGDAGVNFFLPHDAEPAAEGDAQGLASTIVPVQVAAVQDDRASVLLKLYRAALREASVGAQLLTLLLLLDEAAIAEPGSGPAERLRAIAARTGAEADWANIATQIGMGLPAGVSVADILGALRLSMIRTGRISAETLTEVGAAWAAPVLERPEELGVLIDGAVRTLLLRLTTGASPAIAAQP